MILYNVDGTLAHSVKFSTKAFLSSKLGVEAVLIANTNIRFVAFFVKTDANLACHDHTVGCPKSLKHGAQCWVFLVFCPVNSEYTIKTQTVA